MWFRVLSLIFLYLNANVLAASDSLLMVQAIWRHGSRTPIDTYPNDPIQKWPEGWGQLTQLGFKQQYNLGKTLRERYITSKETAIKGISQDYQHNDIYVQSTDYDRTLVSAATNMVAFYPYGIDGFNPVPVHTASQPQDNKPKINEKCDIKPNLEDLFKETPEYKIMQQSNSAFFDFLTIQTGMSVNPGNLEEIYDATFIELQNNKSLPDWVHQVWENNQTVYEVLKKLSDEFVYWEYGQHLANYKGINFSVEIPKYKGGALLWSLIDRFQKKWDCEPSNPARYDNGCNDNGDWLQNIKYYAFSAHDVTIASLFSVFGFENTNYFEAGFPHYSSCVTLELWQNGTDKSKNYVKAYYLPLIGDYEHTTLFDITPNITNCGECDLAQFAKRSELYMPCK